MSIEHEKPCEITIEANGMTLAALAWGDGEQAPLALLLHGYPDTPSTWRYLGPHLAKQGWRVVAPFTRGYGPSDLAPDGNYRISALAADALALADALGADDSAALIGHDWGALTAWRIAAISPKRFSRIVSLAAPPPTVIPRPFHHLSQLPVAARQLRMSWYALFNALPGAWRAQKRLAPYLWRTWSPGYDATSDLSHVHVALNTPQRLNAAALYYRHNFVYEVHALLNSAPSAPVLTLLGRDDGCGQAALLELNPSYQSAGSRFEVINDCGHFVHLEQPEAVHQFIDSWLHEPPWRVPGD